MAVADSRHDHDLAGRLELAMAVIYTALIPLCAITGDRWGSALAAFVALSA